ncbi:MAG TPA: NAD(+) synthase, partial [Propionibacteriaceae bacterium]|nr:NAD(+) synthase [Propionibacteriaceae bacterium]
MSSYGPDSLRIDAPTEADRICDVLRTYVRTSRRKGAVVAVSGGIDSSVVAALCVRAL